MHVKIQVYIFTSNETMPRHLDAPSTPPFPRNTGRLPAHRCPSEVRSLKIEMQKEGALRLLCPYESHTQTQNTRRQNHFSQGQEGKRVGAHKASHRGVVQLCPGCKMHLTCGWGTLCLTHASWVPQRPPFSHWWGPTLSLVFGRLFGILWPWKQANIGCAWELEKVTLKDIPTRKAYRKSPLRMIIFKSNIMAASWTLGNMWSYQSINL